MAQFDHIFIACSDFDKAFDFYHNILGWKNIEAQWGEQGHRGAILKSQGNMSVVIAEEHDAEDNSWTHGFNGHRPTMHLFVDDLDLTFKQMPQGSHVLVPPQETHWGTRWFVVKDPDDNIIAFNQKK